MTDQELLAYDKQQWKSHQQDACEEGMALAAETSAGFGATAVACGSIVSGAGAIACGFGVVVVGIGVYKTHKADKECTAEYPGMGNW